jgi:hypothetical protein
MKHKCFSASNNMYHDYPPLMSDARTFTPYESNAVMNKKIKYKYDIVTNYDYRMFLTRNGNNIISQNQKNACDECGFCQYGKLSEINTTSVNNKYLYKGLTDDSKPYGYQQSDLKSEYVDKQALQSRMYTPLLDQNQLLGYLRDK